MYSLNEHPIEQWTITELQQELKRRNLPVNGLKPQLVKRLVDDLQDDVLGSMDRILVPVVQHTLGGGNSYSNLQSECKVTVRFVPDFAPLSGQRKTYDVSVHTTIDELSQFVNAILKSVHEDHEQVNFEFLLDGKLIEQPLQDFLLTKSFENEVIELEYVEAFSSLNENKRHEDLVRSPVLCSETLKPFIRINYAAFIPNPQGMFMPNRLYEGTCLGHSLAETISSRIKYKVCREAMSMVDAEIVSVLHLVSEMLDAGVIEEESGYMDEAMNYLVKKGAPLESGGRVEIKAVTKITLTRLNSRAVSNLSDQEFDVSLANVIDERAQLCAEMHEQGPVLGFFRAGDDWMRANGQVYYDEDEGGYVTLASKLRDAGMYIGHCVLVYGAESPDASMMDLTLNVQDNYGEESHDKGRAHMHISALRGYLAPVL